MQLTSTKEQCHVGGPQYDGWDTQAKYTNKAKRETAKGPRVGGRGGGELAW